MNTTFLMLVECMVDVREVSSKLERCVEHEFAEFEEVPRRKDGICWQIKAVR